MHGRTSDSRAIGAIRIGAHRGAGCASARVPRAPVGCRPIQWHWARAAGGSQMQSGVSTGVDMTARHMAILILLAGCAAGCTSVEPTFAIPLDCQHAPQPDPGMYPEGPASGEAGRRMSADCLQRIDNSRVDGGR